MSPAYRFGDPPPFGARGVYQRLCDARQRLQVAFPDDGTREIPEVLAVFESIDSAIRRTRALLSHDNET